MKSLVGKYAGRRHPLEYHNRYQLLTIAREVKDPAKIEEQLMSKLPSRLWDAGMAMSFPGREICGPKPLCAICLMRNVCMYYHRVVSKGS